MEMRRESFIEILVTELTFIYSYSIRVTFSISDVENEPVFDEDEQGEDSEEAIGSMFPLRCSISITKPAGGAISIEALAQDGIFSIEHVSFYKDAKLATDLTSEADWKRRATYLGPQFEHLDVTVQEGLEAYLAERGIDESLALFIPDYAEWKEQKVRNKFITFQEYIANCSCRNMFPGSRASSPSSRLSWI